MTSRLELRIRINRDILLLYYHHQYCPHHVLFDTLLFSICCSSLSPSLLHFIPTCSFPSTLLCPFLLLLFLFLFITLYPTSIPPSLVDLSTPSLPYLLLSTLLSPFSSIVFSLLTFHIHLTCSLLSSTSHLLSSLAVLCSFNTPSSQLLS